jgi:hypothetical protein
MRLEKLPAPSRYRKLLQQRGELQTTPGHSYSNSTASQVVTQASLENANMIVAILVGVVTIIGGILGVIKFLSWWQERQQALQRVCTCSILLSCMFSM